MRNFFVGTPLQVDAYQAGHFLMIPPGMENFQCSQVIDRKPLFENDHRLISAGLDLFVLLELLSPLTKEDIDDAEDFYSDFHAELKEPFCSKYPWPKKMFERILKEFDGYLPIVVTGLNDGQAHYVGEPKVQVWTDVSGMGELVGWIESTMLPYLWTSTVVATKGRKRKELFINFYKNNHPSLKLEDIENIVEYKFHDFGRRGAANSQITGIAHLINFKGTDTIDAAWAATHMLNDGKKFGACSIMAAAHRTITPWKTEDDAYRHQIPQFAHIPQSVVADSYNFEKGVEKLATFANVVKEKGGLLVFRPDSGDPVECVIKGLKTFESAFGYTELDGLKVLNNAAGIQGDGINDTDIFEKILPKVVEEGFSPLNMAFGMGQENHKALRSDIEEAYKTCLVIDEDENPRPVMKASDSLFKRSLPCPVGVLTKNELNRVYPINIEQLKNQETGDLFVHYDYRDTLKNGPVSSFSEVRERAYKSWNMLEPLPKSDTFVPSIRKMQEKYIENH